MLICPSPVTLTNMIYILKVQNVFTYCLIIGNISNSLKNKKLSKTLANLKWPLKKNNMHMSPLIRLITH